MPVLEAAKLKKLLNDYTIKQGPPHTIVVPQASELAGFQDITVTGTLLKKQLGKLDLQTNERSFKLTANGGKYTKQSGDGDLHFCLGVEQFEVHIACELQNAKLFLQLFNNAIGQEISVSGFFRCLFEHPGFNPGDDPHLFEIHPVRAVNIDGQLHSFDVDVPEQDSIHTWTSPHQLNTQDQRITVAFDPSKDALTFSGMGATDTNYVVVSGKISNVKLPPAGGPPASFTFTSDEIGHPIQGLAMQGTTAARALRLLTDANITDVNMVALRNVDLAQAVQNKYVITLLAINIKDASTAPALMASLSKTALVTPAGETPDDLSNPLSWYL